MIIEGRVVQRPRWTLIGASRRLHEAYPRLHKLALIVIIPAAVVAVAAAHIMERVGDAGAWLRSRVGCDWD